MGRLLLACSANRWLRERAPDWWFVRRAVGRFMPGERLEDALAAAAVLRPHGIGAVLTQLGENVTDLAAANDATRHYMAVLATIGTSKLEGVNNKIKVIKRKAYGFHDERYFALKIIQAFSSN